MKRTRFITHSAVIAALYVVLTLLANLFGLSNCVIQVRFSEALTILPIFTPTAIPGLFIGCLLSNILTGALIPDIIFGSLATLIGAFGTYWLRKRNPVLATLPPVLSNTLIVPFILRYAYGFEGLLTYFMLTVGIGQLISCTGLGSLLAITLKKKRNIF